MTEMLGVHRARTLYRTGKLERVQHGLIFMRKCLASYGFVYPVLAEAESSAYF